MEVTLFSSPSCINEYLTSQIVITFSKCIAVQFQFGIFQNIIFGEYFS